MANDLQVNTSMPVAGLGDFTVTVLTAGNYQINCVSTLPYAPAGSANTSSQLQIVLKKNSTTLVTVGGASDNPVATQPQLAASTNVALAANDVIHVVLSSSSAADSDLNAVKSVVNIYQGI